MKAMFRVFQYEFRRNIRRKGYLFMSVGVPIIAIILFNVWQVYQQGQQKELAQQSQQVVNKLTDNFSPMGVVDNAHLLSPSGLPKGLTLYPNTDAATKALLDSRITSYWVIDADYIHNGKIDLYFNRASIISLDDKSISALLSQALLERAGTTVSGDLLARLEQQPTIQTRILNAANTFDVAAGEGASFILVYFFAMALLFSAFVTSSYLMQSVVEEKQTRMVEILLSSVRPMDLLAGKTLAFGLLGLIQMALWGSAVYYIGSRYGITTNNLPIQITTGQIIVLFLYYILGYLYFASAYASIGALSSGMREGPQLAAFISIPAVIPLYMISVFTSSPEGPVAVGLSLFPLTAPLAMVMREAIREVPVIQIIISTVLMSVTIAFMIWVAGRLFRVNVLLSGQMPKIKDIPKLIFEQR